MILTSYFANHRNFIPERKKVSISRITPSWFEADEIALELAPSKKLLFDYKEGGVSEEEYIRRYKEETLSKLNPFEIAQKYNNSIFLCYEKTGDFCHRHIVSEWLEENELLIEEIIKNPRIAVVGSRNFSDYEYFKKVMDRFLSNYLNPILVSGGANGADAFAERYAKENNFKMDIYPAEWYPNGVYDKAAGFKRNTTIWNNSDLGIAFWDGKSKGTSHSFNLAKKQNKRLYIVEYTSKKIYLSKV